MVTEKLVRYRDVMPSLLEQSEFADPMGCCISFFFSTNTPFSDFWCVDSRNVKPKLNFVVVQSLNWILRFEVYAHSNGHSVPQDAIAK